MSIVTTKLEEKFRSWAKPLGDTEQQRCDNAVSMVKDAIDTDSTIGGLGIRPFGTGSAVAGTNIKTESDADIAAPYSAVEAFGYALPPGRDASEFGINRVTFDEGVYKNMVEAALVRKFGRAGVVRGNKALLVRENTYRVKADVVPCMEYRLYTGRYNADGTPEFRSGVRIKTDDGKYIVNWPHHSLDNGIEKNKATGTRYKSVVRVLKKLKYEMADARFAATGDFPSFLIQSLAWNVHDGAFAHDAYEENVRSVVIGAYNLLGSQELISQLNEENGIKSLFEPSQAWTVPQTKEFLEKVWGYCKFN